MGRSREPWTAGRILAVLGTVGVLYVGRTCAGFAALGLVWAVVEGAWGPFGVAGMAVLGGSVACGIATQVYLKRDDDSPRRLLMLGLGAALLMLPGFVLVALELKPTA